MGDWIVSPEEGVKQFDEAIEKLNDVKRDKEKTYLLEVGLPEMMGVVLESRYLVDTFHKKITELVQKALIFALDGFPLSLSGSCQLVIEIFGHRHFSEIASQGLALDEGSKNATGRELLTQSKRIKTYGRLNESLATFCDQKGYTQLLSYLERPNLSLVETRDLLRVAVTMGNYLNASTSTMMSFVQQADERLLDHVTSVAPFEAATYIQVKELVRQLIELRQTPELTIRQDLWRMSIVTKLARDLPVSLPLLFMQYPEKTSSIVNLDPTKLQTVKDAREEFCKQRKLDLAEVVFKSVSSGVIRNLDDQHALSTMFVQNSYNVAYQVPVGWHRKFIQILFVDGKQRPDYIPFYAYVRRKDLTGKHLHETILPSSFIFTVRSMTETPFTLKSLSTGKHPQEIPNTSTRLFPELYKGDSITVRVDWSDSADSSAIQTNELAVSKQAFAKKELVEALHLLQPRVTELRAHYAKAQAGLLVTEIVEHSKKDKRKSGSHGRIPSDFMEVEEHVDKDSLSESGSSSSSSSSAEKEKEKKKEKHKEKHKHKDKDKHKDKKKDKHDKRSSKSVTQLDESASTALLFSKFFEGLSNLLGSCDLDVCKCTVILYHSFSSDTAMRDLLATYSPVPRLQRNLASPSIEVRHWSSQTLTFFGHDTFFYQRPTESFERFDERRQPPTHLDHRDSEIVQFLYQVNSLRTVDPEFIDHATTEELYWMMPLVFQTLMSSRITKEGSHANATLRFNMHLLLLKLQPLSYLRQFALWLKFCGLVEEREFDLEWAIGSRFEATRSFFIGLAASMPNLDIGKRYSGLDIMDPMHDADGHNLPLSAVTVLKVFSSKAKPCLLELHPADSKYPSRRVIFKKGDDLRQDLLVQACFYLFNVLWQHSDLDEKPFIHQYRLIPMGPDIGCVEFVQDSESLQTFSFEKMWPKYTEEEKTTLLRSAAGSYVAGWVMGVRDRHQDNMMVQHGNMFFHIDLGHIFNEKPTIDAPRFSIPTDLKECMAHHEWERFKDLCANGFKVLHRNAGMLVNLITLMFRGVVDDLAKTRMFLASPQSLMIGLDEKDACDKIHTLIDSGVTSVKKKGKYLIHTIFVGSNGKPSSAPSRSHESHVEDESDEPPTPSPRGRGTSISENDPPRSARVSEDRTQSQTLAPPSSGRKSRPNSPRGSFSTTERDQIPGIKDI